MLRKVTFLISGVILSFDVTRSQGNTGSIGGVITDERRLPIPEARITIEEIHSGGRRTLTGAAEGTFEFLGLPPGDYRLTVESPGFQSKDIELRLEVNQRVWLEIVLSVGAVVEAIEVTGGAPLIHVTDASVGEVIDREQVLTLPLNGRKLLELALLVPGAHTSHGAQTGSSNALYWRPGQNSAVSISGGRPNSNAYLLDGTINTDPSFNTYVISLSPDMIREFQIQTGTYTAELGGAGTGQVNVVTKSGTNQFQGTIYHYLRNSTFDARLFTSPSKLPHFSQNQFGGTIGGPMAKDRRFFFFGYEGLRSSQRQSMIMSVPPAEWRRGDFSTGPPIYDPATTRPNPNFDPSRPEGPDNPRFVRDPFTGNRIPPDRIHPVARAMLEQFVPLPNLPGESNNFLDTRAQQLSTDQINARLDHTWSDGTLLFGRYSLSQEDGFTPENLPGFGAFHDNRVQNFTLTLIKPFSPRLVNEFRFGAQRMRLHRFGEKANGPDWINILGIKGVGFGGPEAHGLPRFVVEGFDPFGDALLCTPCRYWNTIFQLSDKVAWVRNNHSVKIGGNVRRFRWNMLGFFQNRGFYQFTRGFTTRTATNDGTGQALASFLLGLPVIAQRQAGLPSMNMRQTAFDIFVQDDWRVTSRLTLNLGLRYELSTPLTDIRKILTNLTWVNGRPMAYVGGQGGFPRGLAFTDRNNLAPRLGIAYSIKGGTSVIRAGYGVFYSYPDMNLWCNQVHNVPLVFPETLQSNNFLPSIAGFDFSPAVLGQTRVSFTALDPHGRTPYIQQASLTIERKIGGNTMVQVGYLGAWGKKLDRSRLANNAPPGPGPIQPRRPFQTISFVPGTELPRSLPTVSLTFPVSAINVLENSARSSYNSGWALMKRRFSGGLSLLASYTFSKSLTDAPAFRSPAMESEVPQNSSDLRQEWGLAGCDIRHRFVMSLLYKLPLTSERRSGFFGWMKYLLADWHLAVIHQQQSGFPFTIGVFGDTANAGSLLNINPIRANVVAGVSPRLPSSQRSADRWFNTRAFTTPPAFTFGNVGRNTMIGPSLNKTDIALQRQFPLGEAKQIEFRAEFFNAFNRTNLGIPERFVNTPQFGTITMAATSARQIQFVARLRF